jgi:hypothetical protein
LWQTCDKKHDNSFNRSTCTSASRRVGCAGSAGLVLPWLRVKLGGGFGEGAKL